MQIRVVPTIRKVRFAAVAPPVPNEQLTASQGSAREAKKSAESRITGKPSVRSHDTFLVIR